jgi:translation initiation factor 4E
MASELHQGCDYSLFKKGIRPMWEDDANKRGGRWLISLAKNQRANELDKYWLEIVSTDLYIIIYHLTNQLSGSST